MKPIPPKKTLAQKVEIAKRLLTPSYTQQAISQQTNLAAGVDYITSELISIVDVPLESPTPTDYKHVRPFTDSPIAFVETREKLIRKQIAHHNAQFEKDMQL